MKTLLVTPALLIAFSLNAFGLGGPIGAPQLGHRGDLPAAKVKMVHGALEFMRKELEFIEGSFINEFSNQRYGGESEKVAEFIRILEGIGAWEVIVQFRDFGEQDSAFSLDQNSRAGFLRIIVNSGREDFRLKDFAPFFPPPKLPELRDENGN